MEMLDQYKRLANLPFPSDEEMEQLLSILEMAEFDEVLDQEITKFDQNINEQMEGLNELHLKHCKQQKIKLIRLLNNEYNSLLQ
jgi:hypothetical protein